MMLFRRFSMKMALVVRTDLAMGKGKVAAQCAHAAVASVLSADNDRKKLDKWLCLGQPKIVLKVNSLEELIEIQAKAQGEGVHVQSITDAGHTQVPMGTVTVLGLGPDSVDTIDRIVGHLKLL